MNIKYFILLATTLLIHSVSAFAKDRVFLDYPEAPKTNSHSAEFFMELFENRVAVLTRHITQYNNGSFKQVKEPMLFWAKATLMTKNGKTITCDYKNHRIERGKVTTLKWGLHDHRAGVNTWRWVYDPVNGGDYLWGKSRDGKWAPRVIGHWQESWPRSMAERCPDIKLPDNIPINEKQTSTNYWELLEQDPDAPLRGFKGTSPEAKRLFKGPETLEGSLNYLRSIKGTVFHLRGHDMVLNTKRQELWKLGKDGVVEDVAVFKQDKTNNAWIRGKWQNRTFEYDWTYLTMPLFAEAVMNGMTDVRHPAFMFTDWLTDGRDVLFPLKTGKHARLTLDARGFVSAPAPTTGEDVQGTWWLERGDLNISMGEFGHKTWPWAEFAQIVGYPGELVLKP